MTVLIMRYKIKKNTMIVIVKNRVMLKINKIFKSVRFHISVLKKHIPRKQKFIRSGNSFFYDKSLTESNYAEI